MNQHETHRPKNKKPRKKRSPLARVLRVIGALVLIGVLCYAGLVAYVCYREVNVPAPTGYDAIIVLGAQVKADGEPSVQLRWRLDKALEMYEREPCVVVVCGAQAGTEPQAEAEVMRNLLIADGIPAERIYTDPLSMTAGIQRDYAEMRRERGYLPDRKSVV